MLKALLSAAGVYNNRQQQKCVGLGCETHFSAPFQMNMQIKQTLISEYLSLLPNRLLLKAVLDGGMIKICKLLSNVIFQKAFKACETQQHSNLPTLSPRDRSL